MIDDNNRVLEVFIQQITLKIIIITIEVVLDMVSKALQQSNQEFNHCRLPLIKKYVSAPGIVGMCFARTSRPGGF